MGIKVVDGEIYISEKHQLSKLVDADANGSTRARRGRDVAVRRQLPRVRVRPALQGRVLPEPLGLDRPGRRDDRAAGLRRSRHAPEDQQGHGRDRVRRRRPAHAARHRLGPPDEIFVTDNQGGWLPANKLIHIQPGKFYNHYTTGPTGQPGRFDNQRPTPPALWLPHNEIANSPSQPMLIPSGPFAGQMWIADVTYGGIQRAFLEKVEGEYQGAYFRMTQGLESGITHMLLEDDGSIIVGGLGAGGNWGQDGKLSSASRSSSRTARRRSTSRRWSWRTAASS